MTRESDAFVPLELRAHIANYHARFHLRQSSLQCDRSRSGRDRVRDLFAYAARRAFHIRGYLTLAAVNIQNGTRRYCQRRIIELYLHSALLGHMRVRSRN